MARPPGIVGDVGEGEDQWEIGDRVAVALSRYGRLFAKERNHTLPAAVYHVHEAPCAVFHHENFVAMPLLSTILLYSYGTAACLTVIASSNAQYHRSYS